MQKTKISYKEFIELKKHSTSEHGFTPIWLPNKRQLFDFQEHIADKAIIKGRMGIFIDTGLGKTAVALTIAQNIILKTNKKVLILTPLAVAFQFLKEAAIIGIDDIEHTKDGKHTKKIVLCNYERLHYLKSDDFECVILDESSILKNFNAKTKKQVLSFIKKTQYRYLMSATPSPNDYTELGNSSEALGYMGFMDMLEKYFKNARNVNDSRMPLAVGEQYIMKPHAKNDFFAWVNSWAVMIKMPSDIGYQDDNYLLPPLIENTHYAKSNSYVDENGQMMITPLIAHRMHEVRAEQKETIQERCEMAAEIAYGKTSVYWCNFNKESEMLKRLDTEAGEIIGSQSIDQKEEILKAFLEGQIKRIITKSQMTGLGLNWQHCKHSVFYPTWSYEQYYQSVRRFWRYGQKDPVTIDIVLSEGQKRVMQALNEKKEKAEELYTNLIKNINVDYNAIDKKHTINITLPTFLKGVS